MWAIDTTVKLPRMRARWKDTGPSPQWLWARAQARCTMALHRMSFQAAKRNCLTAAQGNSKLSSMENRHNCVHDPNGVWKECPHCVERKSVVRQLEPIKIHPFDAYVLFKSMNSIDIVTSSERGIPNKPNQFFFDGKLYEQDTSVPAQTTEIR